MDVKKLQINSDIYPDILGCLHSHGSGFRLAIFLNFLDTNMRIGFQTHIFFLVVDVSPTCIFIQWVNMHGEKIDQ
jgi:hypothetical protein